VFLRTPLSLHDESSQFISINLRSGAEFRILPVSSSAAVSSTAWHNADSYDYTSSLPGLSMPIFGHDLRLDPGDYQVVVRYVYDVRVEGDVQPRDNTPVGKFKLDIQLAAEDRVVAAVDRSFTSTVPNIVDSRLAGQWAGVVLKNWGDDWISCQIEEAAGNASIRPVQDQVGFSGLEYPS
jgi:hypothetical protein